MPPLNIEEHPTPTPNGFALFALGFRPFFLAAGVSAVVLIAAWIHSFSSGTSLSSYYGLIGWHSHEMIFGYATAVIAGFLLTAVRNWTGIDTPSGTPLILLLLLWLAGRIAPLFADTLPAIAIAMIDLALYPALAFAVGRCITKAKQSSNMVFIVVLGGMALANLLVHLEHLDITQSTAAVGTQLAIGLIVLLITIMGGRVIPFFTERGLGTVKTHSWPWVETGSLVSLALLTLVEPLFPGTIWVAMLASFAALMHSFRLIGWQPHRTTRVPLLWVLHLAYLWLIVGLVLKAVAVGGSIPSTLALHAHTVGTIGVITLGMMARVAIGHTGREMVVNRMIVLAFILLLIASLVRVILPLWMSEHYLLLISLSGGIWIAAFLSFTLIYTPILIRPRVDGRPG